jgi:hypothetical protein
MPPPPSVRDQSQVRQTSITVRFPPQKQFLSKLVVQCLPCKKIPNFGPDNPDPFGAFATTEAIGGRIVQPDDPINAQEADFAELEPGTMSVVPSALCPLPSALCSVPCAQCPEP